MVGALKQGEFVGSLDCGTTCACYHYMLVPVSLKVSLDVWYRSVRFIVFDKHADIVAQHQLEFPQYYPHPG